MESPSNKILCQSLLYGKYCKLQQNEFIEVYIYIYIQGIMKLTYMYLKIL